MRILVTGHRGSVGGPVAGHLERLGHEVIGFDAPTARISWTSLESGARRRAAPRSCISGRSRTTLPGR